MGYSGKIARGGFFLIVTLIRAFILYIIVIFSVRLMGKRQIGELQPSELVITILLSEIAATPMQNNELPIINSIVAVFLLVSFEIFSSVIVMKSVKLRSVIQGNALIIIRDGVIDQAQLKRLRFTIDDLMEALRQKDVFDIQEVQYAIVETNGRLSVMLKPQIRGVTPELMNLSVEDKGLPCLVVCDGKIIDGMFGECGVDRVKLKKMISDNKTRLKDIMLMTVDKSGNTTIINKDQMK